MTPRECITRTVPLPVIVEFCHPHHPEQLAFLELGAIPCSTADERPCLPLAFALAACRVLTDTSSTCFISLQSKSTTPIQDEFLFAETYYFHASLDDENYLLHYSFALWPPPQRSEIPSEWFFRPFPSQDADSRKIPSGIGGRNLSTRHTDVSTFITNVDGQCALSGHNAVTVGSHIVPQSERSWYTKHKIWLQLRPAFILGGLQENRANRDPLNDPRNYLTHEAGIRRIFDIPYMTYFPFDNKFAAVFVRGDVTYASEYHYRYANLPSRTDPYLLYIRFAWTIFGCATMDESLAYHVLPDKEEQNSGLGSSTGSTGDSESEKNHEAAGDVDMDMDRGELDSMFSELEARDEAFIPEIGDNMDYHPDLARINIVRNKYLEEHPQAFQTSQSFPSLAESSVSRQG